MKRPDRPLCVKINLHEAGALNYLRSSGALTTYQISVMQHVAAISQIGWPNVLVDQLLDWSGAKQLDVEMLAEYSIDIEMKKNGAGQVITYVDAPTPAAPFIFLPLPLPVGKPKLLQAIIAVCQYQRSSSWRPRKPLELDVSPKTLERLKAYFQDHIRNNRDPHDKLRMKEYCRNMLASLAKMRL